MAYYLVKNNEYRLIKAQAVVRGACIRKTLNFSNKK